MFFVTLLNHIYWVVGATIGGLIGPFIHFNTQGLDFVMTALFIVIFLEQWFSKKGHLPSLIGVGLSIICLLIFGKDNFIIPAMVLIFLVLTLLRRPLEKRGGIAYDPIPTNYYNSCSSFGYYGDKISPFYSFSSK